jgi:hypothetical protein
MKVPVKENFDVVEVEGVMYHGHPEDGGTVGQHAAFQRHDEEGQTRTGTER